MTRRFFLIFIFIPLLFSHAQELKQSKLVLNLTGSWKFQIGDNPEWARIDFNDSTWDDIHVPDFWEDQGYPGYDGWAWYRTRFVLSSKLLNAALFIHLGNIDDVDEVYINGRFIAFHGSPPPNYFTAYAEPRWYYIPNEYLNFDDENVIAVRVYDNELGGGIIRGAIGLYRDENYLVPDQSLRGTWKLQTGDDSRRASPSYDDDKWSRVLVPSYWETQGLKGYDGFAWYRREFNLAPALRGKRLILLLGRIDDADEVWLNGRRIGKSGHMPYESVSYFNDEYYRKLRAYFIPPDLPVSEGRNVIAVRVYDGFMHGGIYEGPIGIIRQDRFRYWEKNHSLDEKSSFTKFIDFFLGR